MNNNRRKELDKLIYKIEEIIQDVAMYEEEEQDAFDNLPEGLQTADKGYKMEEAIDQLNEANGCLDDAVNCLRTAQE